jgi:hypothetical protein
MSDHAREVSNHAREVSNHAREVSDHAQHCGNCEAPLTGPYCASCGQHAHASARHLGAVLHDAWHDTTHLDGRLWHTLYLLLARPGQLTVDYFEDRRARYLPPVRLYLVLSVLFFSLSASISSSHRTATKGAPTPASATAPAPGSAAPADADKDDDSDDSSDDAPSADGKSSWSMPCEELPPGEHSFSLRAADNICRHFNAQDRDAFLKTLVHNIPKMMFVFLPLLAAVMLLLYWRPRRFYVEHLVYLLHNHSALFAAFLLLRLVGLIAKLWHPLGTLVAIGGVGLFVYVIWYPYKSMRRYYRQGRLLTVGKYVLIACAYFSCLVLTLLGAAIVTALEG